MGGDGALELAEELIKACSTPSLGPCKMLYSLGDPIKEKIRAVIKQVYGGDGSIAFSEKAEEKLETFTKLGFDKLAVCIAKTQFSLTADPAIKGAPTGHSNFPIVDIRASAGAGFLVPLAGAIQTMPGLPTRPAFFGIDIDPDTGVIEGLF